MSTETRWQFRKEVNLSMVVQLCLIASLIVGSWVNLQRRIDALQRDVESLLAGQERFAGKVERLSADGVRNEYRLQAIESALRKEDRL